MNTENALAGEERDKLETGFLRTCVDDAAEATLALWDSGGKTFWRSTEHRERDSAKGTPGFRQ